MTEIKTLTLTVKGPIFYTELDEAAFFVRLRQLKAVHDVVGLGRDLMISVIENRFDENSIRELICIFYRYRMDIMVIRRFVKSGMLDFFDNPKMYWNNIGSETSKTGLS